MKSILCLIAGLSCIALTGCHTESHSSGGYTHYYSAGYGYNASPQAASSEYSSITPAQAQGKYDAYTTYENGLYPQPAPAPVVTTGPSATASKTDTSAAGGVGSSSTSSQEWINIPVGETTFTPSSKAAPVTTTPETQVQPKAQPQPQPQPESRYIEPQGGVSTTTYSTQTRESFPGANNPYNKSGQPYSAFRGTDQHWYDPEW